MASEETGKPSETLDNDGIPVVYGDLGSKFGSKIGIILSSLGTVVGTGNIWRFPRICAMNSTKNGSAGFLLLWFIFQFMWSIPILVIEYSMGRYTRCGPLIAFYKFLGLKYVWTGGWVVAVSTIMGFYYSVVVGWTVYYSFKMCIISTLPDNIEDSQAIFKDMIDNYYYPIICHFAVTSISGLGIYGGISWIEKINMVMVPIMFAILTFILIWSLSMPNAWNGIWFLFGGGWESILNGETWMAALTQNAFDTGAGFGIMCTFASYFVRSDPAIKYAYTIPLANNLVSLMAGMTIFATSFSTLGLTKSDLEVLKIMQDSGQAGTGLTFSWIPVIFHKVGYLGRILCPMFYICLMFTGVLSQISNLQLTTLAFKEMGFTQAQGALITVLITLILGLPSAVSIDFFVNQDACWAYSLMVSGSIFTMLVLAFGIEKYRQKVVNDFNIRDWKLGITWSYILLFAIPVQAVTVILWWIVSEISKDPKWFVPRHNSFITFILEWIVLAACIAGFNYFSFKKKPKFFINHTLISEELANDEPLSRKRKYLIWMNKKETEIQENH